MNYRLVLIAVFMMMITISCTKENVPTSQYEETIIGYWNYEESEGEYSIYQSSSDFDEVNGYKFLENGGLIDRKNSGFCGTPPISYSSYEGNWEFINDSTILIQTEYWGGEMTYELEIQELSESQLKVKHIYQE